MPRLGCAQAASVQMCPACGTKNSLTLTDLYCRGNLSRGCR